MNRRSLIAGAAVFLLPCLARAQNALAAMTVGDVREGLQAGRLLLIDIRTPAEWTDTGVPAGALKLDAESDGFEVRLAGIRLDNPGKRIVLIDRSGGLSASVQAKLAGRGWRDLAVVRGGMLGPGGWLAEKLPVVP